MPSSMIHLLLACRVWPEGPAAFFIGNIAPDAIDVRPGDTRAQKDRQHLRDNPDRWEALAALARQTRDGPSFARGCLLHLYLDARWDAEALAPYHARDCADGWFYRYREQISLAGLWIFHHEPWNDSLWDAMLKENGPFDGPGCDVTSAEVIAYRDRVYHWHAGHEGGPSTAFPPDFIDEYTRCVAAEYLRWLAVL